MDPSLKKVCRICAVEFVARGVSDRSPDYIRDFFKDHRLSDMPGPYTDRPEFECACCGQSSYTGEVWCEKVD